MKSLNNFIKHSVLLVLITCLGQNVLANKITQQLQEKLDSGADLELESGKVYNIDATLKLTTAGQRIYTKEADNIRDYAIIRLVNPTLVTIINAEGLKNVVIEKVRIDGNRDNLQPVAGKIPMKPFISLGKSGGDDQVVKNCIITNARCSGGWAAIHVHENAFRTVVQDNIIFGSGVDVLGNGRSALEYPFGWGDGISVAARNSVVKNNLIIDAADEGVMVQGAPGTMVKDNVVVAFSREVLGGIALIDPAEYCLLDPLKNTYDYSGIEVSNNLVHALGARVHIGYPCGMDVWSWKVGNEKTIVGAEVTDNEMIGEVGGYGVAVGGVKNFKITGNKISAVFEERGDGLHNNPPDEPAAFIYDKARTFDCELQQEFVPSKKHIIHLMRNSRTPVNEAGYRILDRYGEQEMEAIISTAFMEVLGRFPSKKEEKFWKDWLTETRSNADAIRTALMISPEFQSENKAWRVTQLQECRVQLFMEQLYLAFDKQKNKFWPEAHQLHQYLFLRYSK